MSPSLQRAQVTDSISGTFNLDAAEQSQATDQPPQSDAKNAAPRMVDPRLASLASAQEHVTSPHVMSAARTVAKVGIAALSKNPAAIQSALFDAIQHLGEIQKGVADIKHAVNDVIAAIFGASPDSSSTRSAVAA